MTTEEYMAIPVTTYEEELWARIEALQRENLELWTQVATKEELRAVVQALIVEESAHA